MAPPAAIDDALRGPEITLPCRVVLVCPRVTRSTPLNWIWLARPVVVMFRTPAHVISWLAVKAPMVAIPVIVAAVAYRPAFA